MITGARLMVIYKKSFRHYATSRGSMAFKTNISLQTQFWCNQASSQVLRFGVEKYIFRGKYFCFLLDV